MIQRFHIEDLVLQDSSGVVFRALDTETNQTVAIRRFFPFGAAGGGLHEDEQIAYNIAVARLAGISHPALRAVICGGCDPVDGMPFIATEWIEGTRLQAFLEHGPLAPAEAADLLTRALEVSELLSEVLAEEAVWVETDSQAIVVGAEGTGRGVTFSIAPLKWLGKHDGQRGLQAIVGLTEEIMGWHGITVSDQAGRGLGGWLKWFRGAARTTSLLEARETLAASIGVEPPPPAKQLVRAATRQVVVRKEKKRSKHAFLLGASLPLITIALGGAGLVHWRNSKLQTPVEVAEAVAEAVAEPAVPLSEPPPESVVSMEPKAPEPSEPLTRERSAAEAGRSAERLLDEAKRNEHAKDLRRAEIEKRGNVFAVGDRDLLLEKKDSTAYLEGKVVRVRETKPSYFLEFSSSAPDGEPRGYISKKNLAADPGIEALQKFKGRTVRLHGTVTTPNSFKRPEIEITNLDSIQDVK